MEFGKKSKRFRPLLKGVSLPEMLILLALVILAMAVAIPTAYPYLKKAERQARTIQQWESTPPTVLQSNGN